MLAVRFVPLLAAPGARREPRPGEDGAGDRRDAAHGHDAVRRPADGRRRDHRRPDVPPRPGRSARSSSTSRRQGSSDVRRRRTATAARARRAATRAPGRCSTRPIVRRAIIDSLRQAEPADARWEPGDLRRRGRLRRRHDPDRRGHRERRPGRVRHGDRARPVVHGAVRELRRGDGRGARARRRPRALRKTRADLVARRLTRDGAEETIPASQLRAGRPGDGRGRRADPGRRRHRRGDRLGGRVGDHRRVRAGDPRIRRRPIGGHGRNPRAVGLDQGPDHRASRVRRSSTG